MVTGFDRAAEERTALEADGLTFSIDAGIVALANTLLGTLAVFATVYPDWRGLLSRTFTAAELDEALLRVERQRLRFRWDEPIGAIPEGTRFFGELIADLRHHRRKLAVQLLEATGRLVEVSPGRSKCLVVLSAERLAASQLGLD